MNSAFRLKARQGPALQGNLLYPFHWFSLRPEYYPEKSTSRTRIIITNSEIQMNTNVIILDL